MWERERVIYDGRKDWERSYQYERRRMMVYKHRCDHCGSITTYENQPREDKCMNMECPSNRHMNDDGSRNYGEAKVKSGNSMLLLIG